MSNGGSQQRRATLSRAKSVIVTPLRRTSETELTRSPGGRTVPSPKGASPTLKQDAQLYKALTNVESRLWMPPNVAMIALVPVLLFFYAFRTKLDLAGSLGVRASGTCAWVGN